jgi:hypothetical protein
MTTPNPICILNSMNMEECPYPTYPSDKFDCTLNTDNAYITPSNMCALIECSECAGAFNIDLFTSNLKVLSDSNNYTLAAYFYIKYFQFVNSISEKIYEYDNNYQSFDICLRAKYNEMVNEFCTEFNVPNDACDLFKNLFDGITQNALDGLNGDLSNTLNYLNTIK